MFKKAPKFYETWLLYKKNGRDFFSYCYFIFVLIIGINILIPIALILMRFLGLN